MPAITNKDFSLSESALIGIINQRNVDKEIVNRLRAILNVCMGIAPDGEEGILIRDKIREGQSFLAKLGNAVAAGYIVDNVGKKFLEYSEEIYSCDPDKMIERVKTEKDVPNNFVKIIETCISIYEKIADKGRVVEVYRLATEICDITAFALM